MTILIDLVRTSGFRGINDLEVHLPRVSILVGPNNAGKTTLIKAIQLAIGDYSRYICEEDLHITSMETQATEVLVDVRIVPIEGDKRIKLFSAEWQSIFGDKIQSEANGSQFLVIRTRSKPNLIKGGFETTRHTLDSWPEYKDWSTVRLKESKLALRFQNIPFISMEAQRDIHHDLRDRSSFIGRILSGIAYNEADINDLEALIKTVNENAVNKSEDLKNLKAHLEHLNESLGGTGEAEVTPFPKKIRDLSKNFSVHFGDTAKNSFSMEYHGMGTRSWASMLTIKSFVELLANRHHEESEPFFPVLAVEEPEAHLHPNAQKTLFRQLSDMKGQLIISTHSPYLAAMADLVQIRSLVKSPTGILARNISSEIGSEDKKAIAREVISKRGEILFAKSILLCEGITEEQVLPAFFKIYLKLSPWDTGVSCVSVGGKNYAPFIKMGSSFGIPITILSDNDGTTKSDVTAAITKLQGDGFLQNYLVKITYLDNGNDFESELIGHGLKEEVIDALALYETDATDNEAWLSAKHLELNSLNDTKLIDKMRSCKSSYSGFLSEALLENKRNKTIEQLVPPNIRLCLDNVKGSL